MGKVKVDAKLTNVFDEEKAREGLIPETEVRSIIKEALVDTGATISQIPKNVAEILGLREWKKVKVTYANGLTEEKPAVKIIIEILGRAANTSAIVEEKGKEILIGQVVLEELDLVVDPKRGIIGPRPESPDMPLIELY